MKRLIASLLIFSSLVFAFATPLASAWDPFGGAGCNAGGANSTVCKEAKNQQSHPNQNPLTGSNGLLLKIADIIAVLAGAAAVIIIVLAGLRFIQSGGVSEDVVGARRALVYASVGLIIIVLARTILGFILNAL
jgi:hypothetical protein